MKGTIPDYKEERYTASGEIENIILQEQDVSVQISNSDTGNLYLSYYCADDGSETYKIAEKNGEITVVKEEDPNFGIFIFGDESSSDSYKKVKLTLYLPKDYEGDLSIQTLDGDIKIGDVSVAKLLIETNDGDVYFDDTTITKGAYCETKDGDVEGSLAGIWSEYGFKVDTIDRNCNLNPNAKGSKMIEVKTKEGDILLSPAL